MVFVDSVEIPPDYKKNNLVENKISKNLKTIVESVDTTLNGKTKYLQKKITIPNAVNIINMENFWE